MRRRAAPERCVSRYTSPDMYPFLLALPWLAAPLFLAWRMRQSRSLDAEPATIPPDAPLVSIVIPARDEAASIERCARSALAADWPRLEVLVVDDHSADDTGAIARRIAAEDPRLRVVEPGALPGGWF